jgi:glycosyltransferase involved in cell wall biosynthesis
VRVIHVAPTPFGPDGLYGGGERYPVELARALAGHVDCELVTFGNRAGLTRDPSGLRVRTLPVRVRLRGHPAHPISESLPGVIRGADVVHAHHMRSAPSRVSAVISRIRGRHVVVTDHGLGGGGWFGLLPKLFDRFLTVSEYSARTLRARPDRTRVIYGGADPRRFTPEGKTHRRGVLFVGRLTPHKGVDRLVQDLPEGVHLTIAGSEGHDRNPPERDYPALLRRLASGRDVTFVGPVADQELPALLRSAEVLVIPSVHLTCYGRYVETSELLSLTAIEAMASGTPVVASRIGGIPEILRDGETGFLVEPGDAKALHDRLAELLRNRELRRRMGANGRDLVLERFTWEACADRCLSAYRELLQLPQGPSGDRR